jgi:CheY-like chemotaxis protein
MEGNMNDEAAKLFAGHLGVCAVLVDVLIDKGIISQSELFDRFQQAHVAACQCSAGPAVAHALSEMVEYLEPATKVQAPAVVDGRPLFAQTILLVEEDARVAREIQRGLEGAGGEVLVARNCAEALSRIAQFDFSAAVLDWLPASSEHKTIARWLKEDGVRFVFHAEQPPEDVMTARGAPILLKPARPKDIVNALALLIRSPDVETARELETT